MTRRQLEVYRFIKKYILDNNISPSYDEILQGCGMKSKSHAFVIINSLEKKINEQDKNNEYKCFIVMRCWHQRAENVINDVKIYNPE